MFKLQTVSEHFRKSKIISKDLVKTIVEPDPLSSSRNSRKSSIVYKCKACRRVLATCDNLIPHQRAQNPHYWYSGTAKDKAGSCTQSVSITPMSWMEDSLRKSLSGKLHCPHCG